MKTPITPQEAVSQKLERIPEFIIEAVNESIIKNLSLNGSATVKQDEIIDLAWTKADQNMYDDSNVFRHKIFTNKWLDIEDLFEQYGWKVYYDKPAYNETYPATFEFKPI